MGAQTLGKIMELGFSCHECAILQNFHNESTFSSSSTQANRHSSIPIYFMTHPPTPGVLFIIGNIALKPRIESWRTKHCSISFHETMFHILKQRWHTLVIFGSRPRTMVIVIDNKSFYGEAGLLLEYFGTNKTSSNEAE